MSSQPRPIVQPGVRPFMPAESDSPTAVSPAARGPAVPKTVAENVKETLESIVIAFILAFVFRAFIVEAFVIPTGSMAVTLYGQQLTNSCSTCGLDYAHGVSLDPHGRVQVPRSRVPLRCPNCDTQPDHLNPEAFIAADSGDRILVQKWMFDLPGNRLAAERWDVVVFKDPRDGVTNFIKRLIGMPGEVLVILDGDIYAAPLDVIEKEDPDLIAEMEDLRREVYEIRAGRRDEQQARAIRERYREANLRLIPFLEIQRKTPKAQRPLWFNVYNHDHMPNLDSLNTDERAAVARWAPVGDQAAGAWDTGHREIRYAVHDRTPLAVRFTGKPIEDFYAYNNDGIGEPEPPRRPVGDLRLRFIWFPEEGDGGLVLTMSRHQDTFTATLGADGTVLIESRNPYAEPPRNRQMIGEATLGPFHPSQAVAVEFTNVDYRVALQVNHREIIASTDEQYRPDLGRLVEVVRHEGGDTLDPIEITRPSQVDIAAFGHTGRLRHLVLERDVYYRSVTQREPPQPNARDGRTEFNRYDGWPGWGAVRMPILLRPEVLADGRNVGGEYYMLGDNSPQSMDSRLWWQVGPHLEFMDDAYQPGTVTEDQLIGKAFFVYWPAGYRIPALDHLVRGLGRVGFIPNFGRMRWIR